MKRDIVFHQSSWKILTIECQGEFRSYLAWSTPRDHDSDSVVGGGIVVSVVLDITLLVSDQ